MKVMLNNIGNYIMFVLSYSPVVCCSDDDDFGTNQYGFRKNRNTSKDFSKRIRISLFSFYFGSYKCYFLSLKKNEQNKFKFNFKHKLDLNKYKEFKEDDKQRVIRNQEIYLNSNMDNSIGVDKEFILYLFQNENNRKSTAYNKINTYTTIVLAIIPLILVFFKPKLFIDSTLIVKVLILILFYILINISVFVLQSNKVKGYERTRYSDLKQSVSKEKDIIKAYYLDWQSLRYEADSIVSFVKNIEVYIRGAIIVTLLITSLNLLKSDKQVYTYSNSSNSLVEVDINKLEVKDNTTVKIMNEINEKVSDDSIEKIIIIYSDDKTLDNASFKAIRGYFSIYKKNDDIILLKETSSDKESKIKIITVKE